MIRPARPADIVSIMRIARQGFTGDDRFGTVWFVKKLAEPGTTCLVDDAGVGFIRGFIVLQKYDDGNIVRLIGTDGGCRSKGTGSALLSRVAGPAGAWVREENMASRRMFEKNGWAVSVPSWAEPKKPSAVHTGNWLFFAKGEYAPVQDVRKEEGGVRV